MRARVARVGGDGAVEGFLMLDGADAGFLVIHGRLIIGDDVLPKNLVEVEGVARV